MSPNAQIEFRLIEFIYSLKIKVLQNHIFNLTLLCIWGAKWVPFEDFVQFHTNTDAHCIYLHSH